MKTLVIAIHGILTGQTNPSWPDRFDAWMAGRDPEVKVVKKEYGAGPFPRWNCWVKDPRLARALANEIELFAQNRRVSHSSGQTVLPPIWLVAHSNGAVIALLVTEELVSRGRRVGGLLLTGAACEADVVRNGVWTWTTTGRLGAALAYASEEDAVVAGDPRVVRGLGSKLRAWLWGRLIRPYGCLGRTGWLKDGKPLGEPARRKGGTDPEPAILTRWVNGGHGAYFAPQRIEATFEQIYQDMRGSGPAPATIPSLPSRSTEPHVPAATTASLSAGFLAQLPTLPPGALETWLLCAAGVGTIAVLALKLLVRKPPIEAEFVSKSEFRLFRESVERELNGLRDRIDARFLSVIEKIEQLKTELLTDGERRSGALQQRLNQLEAGVARLDERTRGK
jgi:hypothetical protein